ncbi:GNAT family N-acetyltransferase [Jeongeupia naejangsanensis]|uniref:GNAT family N-acetyltransferase n=1 Tax=Jeongeupia naejangsanensis TaxID=613195 RepID=A0ABS2BNV1_9NEIS|nr:GNAT family N-acetyltransferase [Jeongeupia naejangsanensis]MBM3117312.1 GNAT family N-acetyltransferase [Jeongeupia naejangsanensis]
MSTAADKDGGAHDVVVRYASLDDLDRLAPLFDAYRVFYEQASDPALARAFLAERLNLGESVLLLAETGGVACGFIQLYPYFSSIAATRAWSLMDLYVAESARGAGVARLLMNKAAAHARATGASHLELSTAHTNTRAQALYESLGYELDTVYRYYSLLL